MGSELKGYVANEMGPIAYHLPNDLLAQSRATDGHPAYPRLALPLIEMLDVRLSWAIFWGVVHG